MEISWLGHACFRLKGTNTTLLTDPYAPETGYDLGKPAADIVTVSHAHPGHSFVSGVTGNCKIIRGPGEYEIGGVSLIGIPSFHDAEEGRQRGRNTIYVIEMDGLRLCHLGDLGHSLKAERIEEIGNIDILFLPVGEISTLEVPQAAELVRRLEPSLVIPMHYGTEALKRPLAPLERYLKETGVKEAPVQPRLAITRNKLPETTQVCRLEYRPA
jgi:L-ascorbate metabolism protein UlaG (beta-lactamase superfamily)